jgi:hypothetical protein
MVFSYDALHFTMNNRAKLTLLSLKNLISKIILWNDSSLISYLANKLIKSKDLQELILWELLLENYHNLHQLNQVYNKSTKLDQGFRRATCVVIETCFRFTFKNNSTTEIDQKTSHVLAMVINSMKHLFSTPKAIFGISFLVKLLKDAKIFSDGVDRRLPFSKSIILPNIQSESSSLTWFILYWILLMRQSK